MLGFVMWVQGAAAGIDIRTAVEIGTIVFFGGASWQQLRDVRHRLTRIEAKIFNGK